MSSGLRARLTIGGIALAVLAVALTAWITARTTTADLVGDVDASLEAQSVVLSELTTYAVFNGSWDGVSEILDPLSSEFGVRLALTDLDGRVLADSDPDDELPAVAAALIDPTNPLFAGEVTEQGLEEAGLFSSMVAECLEDAGVPFTVEIDEFGLPLVIVSGFDDEDVQQEADCYDQAFEEFEELSFDDFAFDEFAEPALLFLGNAPTPTLDSRSLIFAALLVIGVLVVAATVFADRITRPLHALTTAARAVREGELSHRVEVDDQTEVGELAAAFNEMTGELEDAQARRRQFTTDVAHELRTPLANITGHVEAMLDGVEDPTEETLGVVRNEVYRLGGLVDDLQQLALADEHALTLDTIPLVLDDIVDQVVAAHRHRAESDDITLVNGGQAPEPVELDPRRIRQVVDNLVTNAIRHTPAGGTVRLDLSQDDAVTVLTVTDTGPGIPDEFLPHIFDRFARADRSRSRATGGSGLGLAIARELVVAQGGTLEVANTDTGGAVFTITLLAG